VYTCLLVYWLEQYSFVRSPKDTCGACVLEVCVGARTTAVDPTAFVQPVQVQRLAAESIHGPGAGVVRPVDWYVLNSVSALGASEVVSVTAHKAPCTYSLAFVQCFW
jgi:hypothetical protein